MIEMEVLFATTNPAKVKSFADEFAKNGIKLLTLKDLNLENIEVDETGENALENAYIKAKTFYDIAKIPTIGMDNNLFIDDIPEEKQPGTHVRRVNGKILTDDEMIEYYSNLVKEYGKQTEDGKRVVAKWVYGLVICSEAGKQEYTWSRDDFYLVEKASENRNPGYPLNSIAIIPEFNKYLVDLSPEEKRINNEKTNHNTAAKFVINILKSL